METSKPNNISVSNILENIAVEVAKTCGLNMVKDSIGDYKYKFFATGQETHPIFQIYSSSPDSIINADVFFSNADNAKNKRNATTIRGILSRYGYKLEFFINDSELRKEPGEESIFTLKMAFVPREQ
ncbi:MAG: hypothetical protein ACP5RP_02390 [Candidatus Micrarchaeia archaeon]